MEVRPAVEARRWIPGRLPSGSPIAELGGVLTIDDEPRRMSGGFESIVAGPVQTSYSSEQLQELISLTITPLPVSM